MPIPLLSAMRRTPRASASSRFLARVCATAALVFVVTAGVVGSSVAGESPEEDDTLGQLSLNTTVLVNESVGAGVVGDFAVRGELFTEPFSTQVQEQRQHQAERLAVVERLDFAPSDQTAATYQPVRAALFGDYSSTVLPSAESEPESTATLYGIAVVAVPLVLVAGVVLGKAWAKRKRVRR